MTDTNADIAMTLTSALHLADWPCMRETGHTGQHEDEYHDVWPA